MVDQFSRTRLMFGQEGMQRLFDSKVVVFGVGGVGGYAVEALARSGIGQLDLVDHDKISITNINRQIHATRRNIGEYKVEAAKERIREINPDAIVNAYKLFYSSDNCNMMDWSSYDYIVDAIDTVTGKIQLAVMAYETGTPIISSMGAGNKLDPTGFMVADVYETSVCPLAKVMRKELRKRGIPALQVVYSREQPIVTEDDGQSVEMSKPVPSSNAFVPAAVGLIMAGQVVRHLSGVLSHSQL